MVRHDLPTPPPPTTTSLYSRRNCGDGERQQSADSAGRAATKKRPSESLTLDAMVSGRRLRNEETKWEGQKKTKDVPLRQGPSSAGDGELLLPQRENNPKAEEDRREWRGDRQRE